MNEYRLYILIRNDLDSMKSGRAMAQASHASNAFIHKFNNTKEVKLWQKETTQGFGTTIVLSSSLSSIRTLFNTHLREWKWKDYVVDPEYSMKTTMELFSLIPKHIVIEWYPIDTEKAIVFSRKEVTCAYVFGKYVDLNVHLGSFNLHP